MFYAKKLDFYPLLHNDIIIILKIINFKQYKIK